MVKNEKTFNYPIWKRYLGMEEKHILIVSYKLGIENGVGGRRWLNYGLELLNNGFDVHFLTYQKNIPQELSDKPDRLTQIKGNYPLILNKIPKTIISKIRYRFWDFYLNTTLYGTPFDETKRTKQKFIHVVLNLIKQKKITHLIISGAPFSLLYFGTIIKNNCPNVKLISDYRDAWTNGIGYGIPKLTTKKIKQEIVTELEVLKKSDLVIVASKDVEESIKLIYPSVSSFCLPNFSDPSKYNVKINLHNYTKLKNQLIISHIGTVNKQTEKYWKNYFSFIQNFSASQKIKITTQFVGGVNPEVENYVSLNQIENINFIPYQKESELSEIINNSDLLLMFKIDKFPHSFPTKFFDYIIFRKPILCYSLKGMVTEEIENNRIGLVFNETTSQIDFDNNILKMLNGNYFNPNYDYKKYSLNNLTKNLIQAVL